MAVVAAVLLAACAPASEASGPPSASNAVDSGTPSARPTTTSSAPLPSIDVADLTPIGPLERATLVRIVDGDTIVVDRGRGRETVRYIGMDTPETVRPGSPVEFMGPEATAANAALLGDRDVFLERDVSETDRFDRLLRNVWVQDPGRPGGWLLVNLALVAGGWAQVSTFPPDVRYVDELLAAQAAAREAGVGLWSGG
jgi:endonuclease YncB( thermonuclease family)